MNVVVLIAYYLEDNCTYNNGNLATDIGGRLHITTAAIHIVSPFIPEEAA